MLAPLIAALLGILLGARHAFEPDHLAAVSTLAAEERGGLRGLFLGALWGAGHSASLLLVGGALAIFETQMPTRVADSIELFVAAMILLLGLRAIVHALRAGGRGAVHLHHHGQILHLHPAPSAHVHLQRWTFASRPLLIGLVHGLAGSGALTALVLAELPSVGTRLTYIGLFAVGSAAGMAALTALFGLPLGRLQQAPRTLARCLLAAGVLSAGTGVWWGFAAAQRLVS